MRVGLNEISVQGIWIRRIGQHVECLAEINGEWRLCIEEFVDAPFSHIIEPAGIQSSPRDRLET